MALTQDPTSAPPGTRQRWALPVALVASFMAVFDLYVVNIAAPALRTGLHTGDSGLELVVSGYSFAYAAGLVTGGRLGDRFGYRRLFVAGMAAFTVTSLLCALSQTTGQLVAARVAQGLSAAAMVPQVLSLITITVPAEHRGRATAWYGAVLGVGAISGQVLGGLLLVGDPFGVGWRSIFLVNVPVGAVAALLASRVLPGNPVGRRAGFDPLGAAGVSAALALLLVPLSLGREAGWPAWTWVCLAAVTPAALLTMRWQRALSRRGGEPVVDPALFASRGYTLLLVAAALYFLYFGGFLFTVSLLVQNGLGSGPVTAAMVFLVQGVLFTVASMFSGRLVARHGVAVPTIGGALVVAGMGLVAVELTATGSHLAAGWLSPPLALVGLGNGILLPPLLGAALSRVDRARAGSASGVLTTAQQFASSLGVTVFGTAFLAIAEAGNASAGTAMAVVTAAYMALTAAVVALFRLASRRPAPVVQQPTA